MKKDNYIFSEEAINNIKALGEVLRAIRQDLIDQGYDIEVLKKDFYEKRAMKLKGVSSHTTKRPTDLP